MTGLGIIDTDLCMWAGTISTADLLAAPATLGHPTIKAKPAPIEVVTMPTGMAGVICTIDDWVNAHPVLAGTLVAAGYLVLRRRK